MPLISVHNLVSWFLQIAAISLAGAVLPRIFRIDHPRSHLAYCYLLLAVCLAVPFLQPLQHTAPAVENYRGNGLANTVSLESSLACIFLAGLTTRLGFFTAGVIRLRHYRSAAVPLQFPRESILSICRLLEQGVDVGVSVAGIGPVTLGWRHPTILVPDSFLGLEEDAQVAILCHELLHVTRHDWLVSVLEELIGAAFWFHPGMWFLLRQTKLAREQVVDAEVVRLTGAPEPYVGALLAMAGHPERSWVTAPQFFHRRHLGGRLKLLLMDRPSISRLVSSYTLVTMILGFLFWTVIAAFPLIGRPLSQEAAGLKPAARGMPSIASISAAGNHSAWSGRLVSQAGGKQIVYNVGNGVSSPRVLVKTDPEYSDAARLAKLAGTVVVEGIVMTDGSFASLHTLESPEQPELDHSALLSLKQWKFEPGTFQGKPVPTRLVVEMSFNLKPR